jgi:hypothetical protein
VHTPCLKTRKKIRSLETITTEEVESSSLHCRSTKSFVRSINRKVENSPHLEARAH